MVMSDDITDRQTGQLALSNSHRLLSIDATADLSLRISSPQEEDHGSSPCEGIMTELEMIHGQLISAKNPEQIFGKLVGDQKEQLKKLYKRMALVAHVDRQPESLKKLAEETFKALTDWREKAEKKIDHGTYGTISSKPEPDKVKFSPVQVRSRKHTYTILERIGLTDISNIYRCAYDNDKIGVFKIVRNPENNDFSTRNIENIKFLNDKGPKGTSNYIPTIVEDFMSSDGKGKRHVTVFPYNKSLYSVQQIINAYPKGIDVRDASWMFNRMLEGLWFAHKSGKLNASMIPSNIMLDIDTHGINIFDWSYSVWSEPAKAISPSYIGYYPPEVTLKKPLGPSTDIYMATMCYIRLIGGDPDLKEIPSNIPSKISGFMKANIIDNPHRRPQSAGSLREEFGGILKELYGKGKFRLFNMPKA